ncbi:MAG: hypothetical protein KC776_34215 [Myxococcales bacterium]|nr:hypothetical protein [Myxococcales bacterium]MCB9583545.1 hypothetical protein [Polyangiaceae bacterium]
MHKVESPLGLAVLDELHQRRMPVEPLALLNAGDSKKVVKPLLFALCSDGVKAHLELPRVASLQGAQAIAFSELRAVTDLDVQNLVVGPEFFHEVDACA